MSTTQQSIATPISDQEHTMKMVQAIIEDNNTEGQSAAITDEDLAMYLWNSDYYEYIDDGNDYQCDVDSDNPPRDELWERRMSIFKKKPANSMSVGYVAKRIVRNNRSNVKHDFYRPTRRELNLVKEMFTESELAQLKRISREYRLGGIYKACSEIFDEAREALDYLTSEPIRRLDNDMAAYNDLIVAKKIEFFKKLFDEAFDYMVYQPVRRRQAAKYRRKLRKQTDWTIAEGKAIIKESRSQILCVK